MDEADGISRSTDTLGKGMNPLFSLQLLVNSRADRVLQPGLGNQSKKRKKTLNPNQLNSALKNDPVSHPSRAEALVGRLVVLYYGVSTHSGSFKAELNFKQFSLVYV